MCGGPLRTPDVRKWTLLSGRGACRVAGVDLDGAVGADKLPVRASGQDLRVEQAAYLAADDRYYAAVAGPCHAVILLADRERACTSNAGSSAGTGAAVLTPPS